MVKLIMTNLLISLIELNCQTKDKKKLNQLDFFMLKMIMFITLKMEREPPSHKINTKILIIKDGKEFSPSPLTPMSNQTDNQIPKIVVQIPTTPKLENFKLPTVSWTDYQQKTMSKEDSSPSISPMTPPMIKLEDKEKLTTSSPLEIMKDILLPKI